jgi:hypothetical protein
MTWSTASIRLFGIQHPIALAPVGGTAVRAADALARAGNR